MYFFKHADDQSIVFEELPEHTDLCSNEAQDTEDLQIPSNADSADELCSWFASDEAGFWMSL